MDPDENLRRQLKLAKQMVDAEEVSADDAAELAELVLALDEWFKKGGFAPKRWRRG